MQRSDGPETILDLDWDRFVDDPRRKQAVKEAGAARKRSQVAQQVAKNPKMPAKMQANNRIAVQAWTHAVQAGQMTREEFETTVTGEVVSGRMDPADAQAARQALDGA